MTTTAPRQSAARTAAAGLIGNVLEWFDFAVYGAFATDIGKLFFPQTSEQAQSLAALAVFAIGFVARPIGSVVLGMVGDRIGRRALLTVSIALMGVATLGIGLLPTYASIGVAAPILLILLRMVQGFSLGGEFTGSMVYTTELSSPLLRGLISSSTAAGTTIGFILGTLSAWATFKILGPAAAEQWGWRIPFIGSLVFCVLGYVLRDGIHESEEGEKAKAARPAVFASLLSDWRAIVTTFGIVAMTNASYYIVHTFAVDERRHGGHEVFFLVNVLSLLFVLVAKPTGGWLSDKLGRRRMMIGLTVVMMLTAYPAVSLMMSGTPTVFMLGQLLLAIPAGMALGLQGAMLVEIYPLRTRVTSMSVGYSITLALSGGVAPLIAKYLIGTVGIQPTSLSFFLIAYGVIGLALMLPMRETNGRSLD